MKRNILFILFVLPFIASHGQDAVRVFRSETDAAAYQKNEEALQRLHSLPRDTEKIDSLFQVANHILSKSFLGWKYIYDPTPSYTRYTEWTTQNLDHDKITKLSISDYKGSRLPATLFSCADLNELELINTRLKKIPRKLNRLTKLHTLCIYNNQSTRPLVLKKNNHVGFLKIRSAQPRQCPTRYASFTALDSLDLARNFLTSFPKINGKEKLTKPSPIYSLTHLKEVDFYFNEIEKVGDQIKDLTAREKLYLANNKIYSLSEYIGDLPSLRELYLHHNRISFFPNSFSHLVGLRILRVNDNFFAEFPDQILHMTGLENLDISRNRIQSIPELNALRQLKLLVLTDNPWENPEGVREEVKRVRGRGTFVQFNAAGDESADVAP